MNRTGCSCFSVLAAILTLLCAALPQASAADYRWGNFAGKGGGAGDRDAEEPGDARFFHPASVAIDASGNMFVADYHNHTIRKIAADGAVSTFAGVAGIRGSANGTGSAARFDYPRGLAIDSEGTLYVADSLNQMIRKITSGGVVTTLAGSPGATGSTNGTGSAARFNVPLDVAVDRFGNVYVADFLNFTIRKITSAGVVTTLAGSPGNGGSTNGTGSAARFSYPQGLTVDTGGTIYVADSSNHLIRKVTSTGVVTTLAGSPDQNGSTDGTGSAARFWLPLDVAVDGSGNLYVADADNQTIRKVTSAGAVTTIAGAPTMSGSEDGWSEARLHMPSGLTLDSQGNVFIADRNNHVIRKLDTDRYLSTFAGRANAASGSADAEMGDAQFFSPAAVAVDGNSVAYVADSSNHTIRKITSAGVVSTLAGEPGVFGAADGLRAEGRFNTPAGVALDAAGNIYVADRDNHTIRKITPNGVVSTLAGSPGNPGAAEGTGSAARFRSPTGVAVDDAGSVYVADSGNHTIRKITSTGTVSTIAGLAGSFGSVEGAGSVARFRTPMGVALGHNGILYVADSNNHTIRAVTSAGVVSTFAGAGGTSGSVDGTGSAARFKNPASVAVDVNGNLYVADLGNYTIRKISTGGAVSTIGGKPGVPGGQGGLDQEARFNSPAGIAVHSEGNILLVADSDSHSILRGTTDTVTLAPTLSAPAVNAAFSTLINVKFNLQERPRRGSVKLVFEGKFRRVFILSRAHEFSGLHEFFFPYNDPFTGGHFVAGAGLPEGVYTVTLRYQDEYENHASTAVSTGVWMDRVAPILSLPEPLTFEATQPEGAVVSYDASAVDSASGISGTEFLPASGSVFGLGTTTVNASATDRAGNTTIGSFTVTVQDTTPPIITILGENPATISQGDVYIDAGATALDLVDEDLVVQASSTVNYNVPGQYTVNYSIVDSAGNANAATRVVIVEEGSPSALELAARPGQVPGEPAGTTFVKMGAPSVDAGQIGALARIQAADSAPVWAILGGESGGVLVRQGDAAAPGAVFAKFGNPVFGGGVLGFSAKLRGDVTPKSASGLFTNIGGTIALLARVGDPAPGVHGAVFASFTSYVMPADGSGLLFLARMRGAGIRPGLHDQGLWRQTGPATAELLLSTGDTFSDVAGAPAIRSLSLFAPQAGSPAQRRSYGADGGTAALVSLTDGTSGIVTIGSDGSAVMRLHTRDSVAPLAGASWKRFGLPALAHDGAQFALLANLGVARGVVSRTDDAVIAIGDGAEAMSFVAREGQPVDSVTGAKYASFTAPALNNRGRVAFLARIAGTGVTKANGTVLQWGEPGALQTAARTGSPAAGVENPSILYKSITAFALPDTVRGPVFLATLAGPDVRPANNLGLWALDSAGVPRLLARKGFPLPGDESGRLVSLISTLGAVPGSPGQGRFTDEQRYVAALITFADRTTATVRFYVP